jgi:predicted dehydrogenase
MIAVVGLGAWGQRHVATLSGIVSPGELIGVDPRERARVAAEQHGARTVPSIDQLPDGVGCAVVATPTPTHVDVAWSLLKRGLHLLVEKPLALDPADAARLTEEADRRSLVLMAGHVLLHHSVHQRLRSVLDGLGELRMLALERRTPGHVMPVSGAWRELAPHELAAAVDLGALRAPVEVVGFRSWSATGLGHEDGATAHLRSAGCLTEIRCSWLSAVRGRYIWAVAEGGQVHVVDDGVTARLAVVEGAPDWEHQRPAAPPWEVVDGPPPLETELRRFLAAAGGDPDARMDTALPILVTELLRRTVLWDETG